MNDTTKTSYLVAAIGDAKGILAQCFAHSENEAKVAVEALAVDLHGGEFKARVIDREATVGLWIEGDPEYIESIAAST